MKRLLVLLVVLTFLTVPAYSQMGIARGIAQVPTPPTTPCSQGAVRFARSTNLVYLCGPNNTWTAVGAASGTVTGTGTANQFPIFTGTSVIGNSILIQGTNLIEQKNSTNPQTFRVYGTTANTGEIAQIVALSSSNTVRMGSKQMTSGATGRAFEFGFEDPSGTFLGWQITTSGHLNPANTNLEIGTTNAPKKISLGGTNGTGILAINGSAAGTLSITTPNTITSHTLTLPAAQGAASTVLTNDGAGALSWGAASSGVAPVMEPSSKVPVTSGSVFENVHVSAGSGHKYFAGLGIANATTITADSIWALEWNLPPVLPSGTGTLETRCIANLTTGALKINVKWNVCAVETDCSGVTLNAEGTQTITWGAGDNDQFKQLQTILDASTLTADTTLIMNYTIEDTGTTTADTVTCKVYLTWR